MTHPNHQSVALDEALDVLQQYRQYGAAMRLHGKGFRPVTKLGFSIESVIANIKATINLDAT